MCHHYERSSAYWERTEEFETDEQAEEPAEEMDTPEIEVPEVADD